MAGMELTPETQREIVRQVVRGCDAAWASGINCGRPAVIEIRTPSPNQTDRIAILNVRHVMRLPMTD